MNKRLYLTFIALLFSGMVFSQNQENQTTTIPKNDVIKFGLKGGLNLFTLSTLTAFNTRLNGEQVNTFGFRQGFHAGVFTDIPLSEKVAVQLEILYSQKGGKYKGVDAIEALDYIDVPLLLKYRPIPALNLYLGPNVGLAVLTKEKRSQATILLTPDAYETLDLDGILGIGYQYSRFELSVRYQMGFLGVYHPGMTIEEDAGLEIDKNSRNSGFQVSLAFKLL